jgi:hypothetical protein
MAVITRGFGGRRRDDTDLPLRTRRERTRSAHGDRLDRLVFLVGWHVGVRGELIVGRLAPSWSVLPFAALAGRAAEHPVDPTAEAGKVNS